MTIAVLLAQTVDAAARRLGLAEGQGAKRAP
jgi:hypothetical protein